MCVPLMVLFRQVLKDSGAFTWKAPRAYSPIPWHTVTCMYSFAKEVLEISSSVTRIHLSFWTLAAIMGISVPLDVLLTTNAFTLPLKLIITNTGVLSFELRPCAFLIFLSAWRFLLRPPTEERDLPSLRDLRGMRNQTAHSKVEYSKENAEFALNIVKNFQQRKLCTSFFLALLAASML